MVWHRIWRTSSLCLWYCWIWMLFCPAVFWAEKKVRFLNLKSCFSNRPWKRKPLSAHQAFSSRMNLTWYKSKVWNCSTGSRHFCQLAFKHLYEMQVCVCWELATQHDVCWLISHGLKTFFLLKRCQLHSPLLCLCVPACACFIRMLRTITCCCKLAFFWRENSRTECWKWQWFFYCVRTGHVQN